MEKPDLYKVRVTLDKSVDTVPFERTYYVSTRGGPEEALTLVMNRIDHLVTRFPGRKMQSLSMERIERGKYIHVRDPSHWVGEVDLGEAERHILAGR